MGLPPLKMFHMKHALDGLGEHLARKKLARSQGSGLESTPVQKVTNAQHQQRLRAAQRMARKRLGDYPESEI